MNSFSVAFTSNPLRFRLRASGFLLRVFRLIVGVFGFILSFFVSVDQLGHFSAVLDRKFTNKRLLHEFGGFLCYPFKES